MSTQTLSQLIQIEQQLRQADSLVELGFIITNYSRQLVQYDQAILLLGGETEKLRVFAASDHPAVDRTSPMLAWIESLSEKERLTIDAAKVHVLSLLSWAKEDLKSLNDFSQNNVLWVPLLLPSKTHFIVGFLWISRIDEWSEKEIALIEHLSGSFAHAINALQKQSLIFSLKTWFIRSHIPRYILILTFLLMFAPVHLSVLAPAEVVARKPFLVTSPLLGVVKDIEVNSGQIIEKDQIIVLLDDQELKSRFQVAEQDYLRALAEWKTAQQSGFVDPKQKSRLNELAALVSVKESEKQLIHEQLTKTIIKAPAPGVAIINDPQEWRGRPVVIGEKILQISDPKDIQLKIMLPVKDAITLSDRSNIRFFPDANPLDVLDAQLFHAAYEPEITPEDVVAFKLLANFSDHNHDAQPPIGWRGTAKIEGEQVSLFYYLFRRPIVAFRQWTGW